MTTPRRAPRAYPVPEAIDGERWSIDSAGPPRCDMRDRSMFVPLDASAASRFLRAHETAHAAITPRVGAADAAAEHGVSMDALQVCEDNRVHWFLSRAGIETPGAVSELDADRMAHALRDDPRRAGAALVATWGTGDYDRLRAALERSAALPDGMGPEVVRRVFSYARIVTNRLRVPPKGRAKHPAHTRLGFKRATVPAALLFDRLFGTAAGEEGTIDIPGDSDVAGEDFDSLLEMLGRQSRNEAQWGDMDGPTAVPMEEPRANRRTGRGRSWRDEGAVPVAMHRWATDGRIFPSPRRAPGGTVLVDVSGSMSLSSEDLAAIVTAAPAATVAMYAGRGERGGLRIVARRGRVASERTLWSAMGELGGGNIVDGPALRWLAAQPAPRVWVCDGQVTGKHDAFALNLFAEAHALALRAGIVRVPGSAAALEALTAGGKAIGRR